MSHWVPPTCARTFTENYRTPDWERVIAGIPITSGQALSLPMIAAAIVMLVWAYKAKQKARPPIK